MYATTRMIRLFLNVTSVNRTKAWVDFDTVTGFEEMTNEEGEFLHTSLWLGEEEILVKETGAEIMSRMDKLLKDQNE